MNALHEVKKMLENKVEPEAILAWINSTGEPSGGKSAEEVLNTAISEDVQKMLLHDTVIERNHNGISYKMVRYDLALLAMEQYAHQQPVHIDNVEDKSMFIGEDWAKKYEDWYFSKKPYFPTPKEQTQYIKENIISLAKCQISGYRVLTQKLFERRDELIKQINSDNEQPVNDGWVRVEVNPDQPRCY